MKTFFKFTLTGVKKVGSGILHLATRNKIKNEEFISKSPKLMEKKDFQITNPEILNQVLKTELENKNYNQGLKFFYWANFFGPIFAGRWRFQSTSRKNNFYEKLIQYKEILRLNLKSTVLRNENPTVLKLIDLKKERRNYLFSQRWNLVFLFFMLLFYTSLVELSVQTVGKAFH